MILLADPQLIDPHTYPGRPWPLASLTIFHTDYYIRRSYTQLARTLHPDSLFFLGDLFDGGREWKTAKGNTEDPAWAQGLRPLGEQAYAESWRLEYGEDFWLREYKRFGDLFYDLWNLGGGHAPQEQRGRRLMSTIPGNHDLGFGAQIKVPVRDRFEAYFGNGNRVDVIGNHTFVSVDSVSLSARSSDRPIEETAAISGPVEEFLSTVQATKRRTVVRELGYIAGEERVIQQAHLVENLKEVDFSHLPTLDPGPDGPDLPTILLTHVPLYRPPGTPCGPMRERFPPSKPPPGQTTPVNPDERNAIRIGGGYQYQNTLGEEDSIALISSIGNVGYVFSGDDHDYCEVVHPANKNHAREITVKSMSYAMEVRKPGFEMLSMWNPIDADGRSTLQSQRTGHGYSEPGRQGTIQTHLCLLPDQFSILINYGIFAAFTLLCLFTRAILLSTTSSKCEPSLLPTSTKDLLPSFSASLPLKEKSEPPEQAHTRHDHLDSNSSTSSTSLTALAPRTGKTAAGAARGRSGSPGGGYGLPATLSKGVAPVVWEGDEWNDDVVTRKGRGKGMANGRGSMVWELVRDVGKVAGIAGTLFVWLNATG